MENLRNANTGTGRKWWNRRSGWILQADRTSTQEELDRKHPTLTLEHIAQIGAERLNMDAALREKYVYDMLGGPPREFDDADLVRFFAHGIIPILSTRVSLESWLRERLKYYPQSRSDKKRNIERCLTYCAESLLRNLDRANDRRSEALESIYPALRALQKIQHDIPLEWKGENFATVMESLAAELPGNDDDYDPEGDYQESAWTCYPSS